MKKAIIILTAAALLAASAATAICVSRNSPMDTILASNVEALTIGESTSDPIWIVKVIDGTALICTPYGYSPCI